MNLESQIESILFWKGEPMAIKKLSSLLEKTEQEIKSAIENLEKNLSGRGVALVVKDGEVMMTTSGSASALIEKITKEELTKDIGKAGLETLAIVIYKGPISRREIDYIRGVNSNFILRNLQIRGLVEKVSSENDERVFLYKPTFELLSYLGVTKLEELPEWQETRKEIENFQTTKEEGTEPVENKNEAVTEQTNAGE